jgi:membrane protease YdiL (CAAX protease family)
MIFGIIVGLALAISFMVSGKLDIGSSPFNLEMANSSGITYLFQGIGIIVMLSAVYIVLRLIDKKRLKDIGLINIKKGLKHLSYGLLFGAISMTLIFIILLISKNIEVTNSFTHPQFSWSTLTGLVLFIFVGLNEELFARGYCMMVLNQTGKRWVPVVVSAIIFSAMHLGNPNVKLLGLFNIFLVGILFAYMVVKTNNIWMAIGYHITWNYFQGNVFGFPVSGLDSTGLYGIKILDDNLLTGGAFGPEAGILASIVLIASILVLMFYKGSNGSMGLFSETAEYIEL